MLHRHVALRVFLFFVFHTLDILTLTLIPWVKPEGEAHL